MNLVLGALPFFGIAFVISCCHIKGTSRSSFLVSSIAPFLNKGNSFSRTGKQSVRAAYGLGDELGFVEAML